MIYLDTHVVVWLYAGLTAKFSPEVRQIINDNELFISPIVQLELQYLYEIQRVSFVAATLMADLSARLGLMICDRDFNAIVNQAVLLSWTRDPFDRVIVANASLNNDILISQDQKIRDHYVQARW